MRKTVYKKLRKFAKFSKMRKQEFRKLKKEYSKIPKPLRREALASMGV